MARCTAARVPPAPACGTFARADSGGGGWRGGGARACGGCGGIGIGAAAARTTAARAAAMRARPPPSPARSYCRSACSAPAAWRSTNARNGDAARCCCCCSAALPSLPRGVHVARGRRGAAGGGSCGGAADA